MIEAGRCPGIGGVAVVTGVAAGDMQGMLAGCRGAIVAARAVAGIGVIEAGWCQGIGGVAVIAGVATGNMVMRFSTCCLSVMAQNTGAGYFIVFKSCQVLPVTGYMTAFTVIAGCHMAGGLAITAQPG